MGCHPSRLCFKFYHSLHEWVNFSTSCPAFVVVTLPDPTWQVCVAGCAFFMTDVQAAFTLIYLPSLSFLYCNDTFLGCVFRTPRLKKKPFSFFYVYFWILVSFPVSSSELYLYSAYGRSAFALLKHWNKYFLFFVISPPYFPLWNERQFMKKHSSFCGRREYLPSSDDFLLWKSQICKPLWVACCQINVHIGDVIP